MIDINESAGHRVDRDSPFGDALRSPRARIVTVSVVAIVLLLSVAGVWVAARSKGDTALGTDHAHGATAVGGEVAVMLTAAQAQRIGVTFAAATLAALSTEVRTAAQITYDETRVKTISPKIEGWIDELYVNFTGQSVRRGEPLLAIYSPMFVSAEQELLLAARLARDMSASGSEGSRGAAELRDAARRRLLYWDIPPADIDRLEQTGEIRKTIVLRAPVSGVVVEKNVLAGQKIMAGDALYKVADLSVVWMQGEVFERDLAAVRLNQIVTAEVDAIPGRTWTGRITYIYPTVNPETRTARVRVELANSSLQLKPGMYATIRIRSGSGARVLSVPRSAVLSTGERNLVFVERADGMLEPRSVTLGGASNDRVQILAGLSVGELVVASATFLVDAESNLGSALGGMGNMPGMDVSAPATLRPSKPAVKP
jgi:membrane fusion protein, copper/silver efflux system